MLWSFVTSLQGDTKDSSMRCGARFTKKHIPFRMFVLFCNPMFNFIHPKRRFWAGEHATTEWAMMILKVAWCSHCDALFWGSFSKHFSRAWVQDLGKQNDEKCFENAFWNAGSAFDTVASQACVKLSAAKPTTCSMSRSNATHASAPPHTGVLSFAWFREIMQTTIRKAQANPLRGVS